MPQGTRKVGKDAHVTIGGTTFEVKSGNFNYTVSTVDVTNSESNGYSEIESAIFSGTFDVTINYRGSSPPGVLVGTEVVVVEKVGSSNRFSTNCVITDVGDAWSVGGDFSVNIKGVTTGVFYPYSPS